MGSIGRYQDPTVFPIDWFVVLTAVCVLILCSVMIIWLCACCGDGEATDGAAKYNYVFGKDHQFAKGGGNVEHKRKQDPKRLPEKKLPQAKNPKTRTPKKVVFTSVVVFNDGKKGRLTKDGTKPHAFTERVADDGKKFSEEKQSQLPTVMRHTGLSPPPSLHAPGKVSEIPKSKVVLDEAKTRAEDAKKSVAVDQDDDTKGFSLDGPPNVAPMNKKEPAKSAVVSKVEEAASLEPKADPLTKREKSVAEPKADPVKAVTVMTKREAEPVEEPKGEEAPVPAAAKTLMPAAKTVIPGSPKSVMPAATKTVMAAKTLMPAATTKTLMPQAAKTVIPSATKTAMHPVATPAKYIKRVPVQSVMLGGKTSMPSATVPSREL